MTPNAKPLKYTTVVNAVKEVSLYGCADLDYWRRRLSGEALAPFDAAGQAELVLIAADMVWKGQRFSELSVSVAVAGADGQRRGMYLIQAFNSVRWLAWAERTFFQTPYYHAHTRVSPRAPVGFELSGPDTMSLRAALAAGTARASRGPGQFAGPVFLPRALTRTPRSEKAFYAELSGETDIYPFGAADQLVLTPTAQTPVVGWLEESGFAGSAWHVRPAAVHKKSATVRVGSA